MKAQVEGREKSSAILLCFANERARVASLRLPPLGVFKGSLWPRRLLLKVMYRDSPNLPQGANAMTSDDGFPEAEDSQNPQYEPPVVFDVGNVVAVTHGSANEPGDNGTLGQD